MDKIDRKIKELLQHMKKAAPGGDQTACPDDHMLSLYLDGAARDNEKERIELHLTECSRCLDLVLLHKKAAEHEAAESIAEVPRAWMENAKNLVAKKRKDFSPLIDIVLEFAKETVEIIRNPGNLTVSYGVIPVLVRSETESLPTNLVRMSKAFPEVELDVEIEKTAPDRVKMKVLTKGVKTRKPPDKTRVSLLMDEREIASHVTRNGEVHIDGLGFGEYVIKVSLKSREIGRMTVGIQE